MNKYNSKIKRMLFINNKSKTTFHIKEVEMKKLGKTIISAAVLFAAIIVMAGCPQKKDTGVQLGSFSIVELKIGGAAADLENLDNISEMMPKLANFEITADADISSVDVSFKKSDGTDVKTKGSVGGRKATGSLKDLPINEKVFVNFTVRSSGKKDISFAVGVTFKPGAVLFSEIFVDNGKSDSSADVGISDGSCVVTAQNETAKLTIKSETKMTAVQVKAGAEGYKDAAKVDDNEFTFDLTGISETPTDVVVKAQADQKEDGTYKFKVKKGKLRVAVKSISVNGQDFKEKTDISAALSANGKVVEFEKSNMGTAEITVVLDEAYESVTKNAPNGFVAKSFTENTAKTEFKIKAMCVNSADGGNIAVAENEVKFTIKANGREDATIKLLLKDKNTEVPGGNLLGIFSPVTTNGYAWNAYTAATPDEKTTLPCFGAKANIIVQWDDKSGFVVYEKDDSNEWTAHSSVVKWGQISDLTCTIGKFGNETEKVFDFILAAQKDNFPALKLYVKSKQENKYGFSFGFYDLDGRGNKDEAEWNALRSLDSAAINEIMNDSTGKTYTIHANKFKNAGHLEFEWKAEGVEIKSAKFKKFKKASNESDWSSAVRTDDKCDNLLTRGFYLLEPENPPQGQQQAQPIGYEANNDYKYEFELTLNDGSGDETKKVIVIFKVQ